MGNENTQSYQVEVVILIELYILVSNLQINVEQLEGRINNQILRVKVLAPASFYHRCDDRTAQNNAF